MLDTYARKYVNPIIDITAQLFIKLNFSANNVTLLSFITGIMAGVFVYLDLPIISVILLWISGYLDAVDGAIARTNKNSTAVGTLMDITFDRLVEISVILGLALRFPHIQLKLIILTTAIIFSMTVFLTVGALTEKKGIKSFYYQAGLAERTEGFIMFSLMILLPQWNSVVTLIFAIIVIITAVQRFLEAKKIFSNIEEK